MAQMNARAAPTHPLEERIPVPVRVVLGGVGGLIPALLITDLGDALWPLNVVTPIAGSIVAGGLFVSGVFLFAGIFGGATRWTLEPYALRIDHEAGRFHHRTRLTQADVTALQVESPEHAGGTFRVCLKDRRGKEWTSPGFPTLAAAQEFAELLGRHLRVAVTPAP